MHQRRPLRIATRRSALARWQAEWVAEQLGNHGWPVELVLLASRGDQDQSPIDGSRGTGFFTKRIQQALLDGEADIAVHSMKDLPTEETAGLEIVAVPPRAAVHDCLLSRSGQPLASLAAGAVVGTGSRRRAAQLLRLRPDLKTEPIRGNVQTRIEKMQSGQFDAILLAAAGLERLQLTGQVAEQLPLEQMLPAPGQGALAIEVRGDDPGSAQAVAPLDDPATHAAIDAERRVLRGLRGGCLAPVAAYARAEGDRMRLEAIVLSTDGRQRLHAAGEAPQRDADSLGQRLADELLAAGAARLIDAARA